MPRYAWDRLTREERALETLSLVPLTPEQRQVVVDAWSEGSYEDTPDGERRALNDLIHLMQGVTRGPAEAVTKESLSPDEEGRLVAQLAEYHKSPSKYAKERAQIRGRLIAAR